MIGSAYAAGPAFRLQHQIHSSYQDAIDNAQSGEVVKLPAGTIHDHLVLKEGVILMGAGAGRTILDGDGYGTVITGAKNAMVIGLTVRNGAVGIASMASYMGIFHNEIVENKNMGIHICGGSAALVNNLIARNQGLGGVAINSGFPYLANNTIVDNPSHGVWAWFITGPYLVNNLIVGNGVGVACGSGAVAKTLSNNIWGNQINAKDVVLSSTDLSLAPQFTDLAKGDIRLAETSLLKNQGTEIAQLHTRGIGVEFGAKLSLTDYRNLMSDVLAVVAKDQPVVRYDLTEQMGLFNVHIKFPNANFSVRASTADTEIREHDAWDGKTKSTLFSEVVYQNFPTIIVKNQTYQDVETDRYLLDAVYYHPGSYFTNPKGALVFSRETTFSRIEVQLPEHFIPTIVNNEGATFSVEDGRVIVSINNAGATRVEIQAEEVAPMVQDVYGLLEAHPELRN
jgi:hypothetical protein